MLAEGRLNDVIDASSTFTRTEPALEAAPQPNRRWRRARWAEGMAAGTEKRTRRAATPPGWVGWLILAIVAIALVTSAMLILLAPAFVPSDLTHGANLRAEAESSIRTTMLQAIGGLVVLVGLCLTARTVYLSR